MLEGAPSIVCLTSTRTAVTKAESSVWNVKWTHYPAEGVAPDAAHRASGIRWGKVAGATWNRCADCRPRPRLSARRAPRISQTTPGLTIFVMLQPDGPHVAIRVVRSALMATGFWRRQRLREGQPLAESGWNASSPGITRRMV